MQSHSPFECCVSEYWSLIRSLGSRTGKGAVCAPHKVCKMYTVVNCFSQVSPRHFDSMELELCTQIYFQHWGLNFIAASAKEAQESGTR